MKIPAIIKEYHANRAERDKNARYWLYNPDTKKILFAHNWFSRVQYVMSTAYMQRARTKLEIVRNPAHPKTELKPPAKKTDKNIDKNIQIPNYDKLTETLRELTGMECLLILLKPQAKDIIINK